MIKATTGHFAFASPLLRTRTPANALKYSFIPIICCTYPAPVPMQLSVFALSRTAKRLRTEDFANVNFKGLEWNLSTDQVFEFLTVKPAVVHRAVFHSVQCAPEIGFDLFLSFPC